MNKRSDEHKDEVTIRRAFETLAEMVPLVFAVESASYPEDELFVVRVEVIGSEFRWCVAVNNRLTKAGELQAMILKDSAEFPLILATKYVPPQAAVRLKDNGIQYIDTAGNAYINQLPLFVFVQGNKPKSDDAVGIPTARLFKGVGLKIIFLLVCQPDLVSRAYRDLADMADVALGTVNFTMWGLTQRGFVLRAGKKGKRLLERKVLFDRWAETYPDNLKPKLLLGRFRGDRNWWKSAELTPALAQWGGEVAAAKLTGYLKPGTVTIYTDKNHLAELVITNRLKKDPQGNVEILQRFWPSEKGFGESDTVHPVLIYADLVAIGEQRTMETARMIYQEVLLAFQ